VWRLFLYRYIYYVISGKQKETRLTGFVFIGKYEVDSEAIASHEIDKDITPDYEQGVKLSVCRSPILQSA
jgi:hypothetical protein